MAIKKYTNGSWVPASVRKYGTETDTITTLPVTIIGDGTPITSYTIKGNTEQTGTPTPENPVDVVGCGERTENLFDKSIADYADKSFITSTGAVATTTSNISATLGYIPVNANTEYTIKHYLPNGTGARMALYDNSKTFIEYFQCNNVVTTFTTGATAAYARFSVVTEHKNDIMLTAGSTAPTSYIPYGYKLPVTLGSTTTDIYLGEVQSTRRVKKLVLTGEEGWQLWSSGQPDVERYYYKWGKTTPSDYGLICTHLPFNYSDGNFEHVRLGGSNREDFIIFISKTIAPTVADFKTFLAQQYANGTPVTVWYVQANPTTGIVNEPLRKIGDYTDSVSGTSLATTGTLQAFDVDTTLKPSEVDMTYHGWHEHDDTKYST